MPRTRTLTLKREALADLTAADLAGVNGANQGQTYYSCYAYISCYAWQCLPETALCVE